jgi:peptidoglycan/xylan/chitin deacetylase (PgdA/CDA1 family)
MNTAIPILLYHSIATDATPQFKKWTVAPEVFAAQVAYLHAHQYTPITVTQLGQAMANGRSYLPYRPVVITFDDGLADFYTTALPILTYYDFVATLYIATGFIGETSRWLYHVGEGDRPMLTWNQITEISMYGIECGAHGHSHLQLDIVPVKTAHEEIIRSKLSLEDHLGQVIKTFAFPHGYYSLTVKRLVQAAGYSSACTVKHALSTLAGDRFALARIIIDSETNVVTFGRLLVGQGLRVAPKQEALRTKGWRLVRRLRRSLSLPTG